MLTNLPVTLVGKTSWILFILYRSKDRVGKKIAWLFVPLLFLVSITDAATITTLGNGNWSSTTAGSPWPGGTIPSPTDDIVIGAGFTLTVDGNRTCKSLTVGNGSTISVNATFILTINGALIYPNLAATSSTGTMTGAGTINATSMVIGTSIAPTGAASTRTNTVTSSITAANITGTVTLTSISSLAPSYNNPVFNLQSGKVTITGTLTCASTLGANTLVTLQNTAPQSGTLVLANATPTSTSGLGTSTFSFNGTASTVEYSGAAQTAVVTSYNNLTLSGTLAKTFANTPTVNGILSMEGTTASMTVTTGVVTYGAAATLQYNKTANFAATTDEWLSPFVASGGVIIKNTGVITAPGAVQIGNNTSVPLNINGGSLTANGLITLHGNFLNTGTFTSTTGITLDGTVATQSIDGFTTTGPLTLLKASGTATLQGNVGASNLVINSGAGATLNLGVGLTHTFTGTWTRTNGIVNGGSSTMKIAGSVSGTGGTFTPSTGTVEWNASGAQTMATVGYNNLILSGSGNKTFGGAIAITSNLSITGTAVGDLGTFTHTANTLTLGGINQIAGSHGSTASAAITKNDTYFLGTAGKTGIINVAVCGAPSTGTATTYYSRASGNWNDSNSWSLSADGSSGAVTSGDWPRRYDNAVILSGHTITIDAIADNNACDTSPNILARASTIAFTGSATLAFYQTGNLLIDGTLTVSVQMMLENYTHVTATGVLTITSVNSLINYGNLEADAGATINTQDDLILAATSSTTLNNNSTFKDDLIISFTSATLCGTGTTTLQGGSGSAVTYVNSATVAQICSSHTITCSGTGCTGFPVTGTGVVFIGNAGPAGVGNNTYNKLWLKADDLSLANGAAVASWSDASGNSLTAINSTAAERPTFVTPSVNGLPSISFDGNNDNLSLGAPAGLNFVPGTNSWTFMIAYRSPVNGFSTTPNQGTVFSKAWTTNRNYQYQVDDISATVSTFGSYIGNTLDGGTVQVNTNNFLMSTHTNNTTTKTTYTNETVDLNAVAIAAGSDPTTEVLIGARRNTGPADGSEGFLFTGNIAELIMYNGVVTLAQRIIISNYIAAKYGFTLTANDVYTMDNAGNGNFDYDGAGIGQASDGSFHKDAKGSGIVRIWNPSALANSRFLTWGNDGTALTSRNSVDVLAPIQERLSTVWRVSLSGGSIGTVSLSFDANAFTSALGSNMRLLIDRDGDGFGDNDVSPAVGTFVDNVVVFTGITFQNGDRFTLGNTDITKPLPIELVDFTANLNNDAVQLKWSTASETNNDYFTIERAVSIEKFEAIGSPIPGGGTTNEKRNYSTTDNSPLYGRSYYRLKQTDFDRHVSYSSVQSIDFEGPRFSSLKVYPNPSNGRSLTVEVSGLKGQSAVPIQIYNVMGQMVHSDVLQVQIPGTIVQNLEFQSPLRAGLYIIKAGTTLQLTQKIIID